MYLALASIIETCFAAWLAAITFDFSTSEGKVYKEAKRTNRTEQTCDDRPNKLEGRRSLAHEHYELPTYEMAEDLS